MSYGKPRIPLPFDAFVANAWIDRFEWERSGTDCPGWYDSASPLRNATDPRLRFDKGMWQAVIAKCRFLRTHIVAMSLSPTGLR